MRGENYARRPAGNARPPRQGSVAGEAMRPTPATHSSRTASAALNRQAIGVSPLIKRQLVQKLRQFEGQIEAIDRRLKTPCNADSGLCQRFDILTSIPGVGEATANALVETPELGRLELDQAASSWVPHLSRGTAARPMGSDPFATGAREPDRLST
jgi:hypothetical protein